MYEKTVRLRCIQVGIAIIVIVIALCSWLSADHNKRRKRSKLTDADISRLFICKYSLYKLFERIAEEHRKNRN